MKAKHEMGIWDLLFYVVVGILFLIIHLADRKEA